jgi:hypothetical protein
MTLIRPSILTDSHVRPPPSSRGVTMFQSVVVPCQRRPRQSNCEPHFEGCSRPMSTPLRTKTTSLFAAAAVPDRLAGTLLPTSVRACHSFSAGNASTRRPRQTRRRRPPRSRATDAPSRGNACRQLLSECVSFHAGFGSPQSWRPRPGPTKSHAHFSEAAAADAPETLRPNRFCC